MSKSLFSWAICLLFSIGCAGRNEGRVEHRLVGPHADGTGEGGTNLHPLPHGKYIFSPDPAGAAINKGDPIIVTLQEAFIANFEEALPWLQGKDAMVGSVQGEIAVLGRARELDGAEPIAADGGLSKAGRVLYYSGDVRIESNKTSKGQYLNFSGRPFYGPISYSGKPFMIELGIIELDNEENQRIRNLLVQLASIGQKAYPPASPVLTVLNDLGDALLSGDQDDTELAYDVTLYPFKSRSNVSHSFLQEGFLVLVKEDHRRLVLERAAPSSPVPWDRLRFDSNRNRLMVRSSSGNYEEYTDHTYLVLRIGKDQDPLPQDIQNAYHKLGDMISGTTDAGSASSAMFAALHKQLDSRLLYQEHVRRIKAISDEKAGKADPYGIEGRRLAVQTLLSDLKRENSPETETSRHKLIDVHRTRLMEMLKAALPDVAPLVSQSHFQTREIAGLIADLKLGE